MADREIGNNRMNDRRLFVLATLFALSLIGYGTGFAQVAWERVLSFIPLAGKPVAASPPILSEHEIQALEQMAPQQQAITTLERAINHYSGAIEWIDQHVDSWRGKLQLGPPLDTLFTSALNANDLRVRAAAIEIDLAAYNVEKTPDSVTTRLQALEEQTAQDKITTLWQLALLGNRGVEPDRVFPVLLRYTRDEQERVRYWAVEGLAYLGTDATIEPLLAIFRNDPSMNIRERAACGLAQSGMLQQSQRMKAVPALLTYLEDATLDATMHQWTVQALQDITGQRIGNDPPAWRRYFTANRSTALPR